MIKIKIVCELPPNAPFGSRPETHFIKLPNSVLHEAYYLMHEKELPSLEHAFQYMLRRGIDLMNKKDLPESSNQ